MSLKIRLARAGSKKRPYYHVVVADARSPRDGRFIEIIGSYDPKQESDNWKLELDRAEYWLGVGAQASQTVNSIIRKAREKGKAAEAAA